MGPRLLTPCTICHPQGWRLLDWSAYSKAWDVPWGPGTTAGGMALWAASFVVVAFFVMPAAYTKVSRLQAMGSGVSWNALNARCIVRHPAHRMRRVSGPILVLLCS